MRVLVIGTSGSGKSTFAQGLSQAAGLPHVELDRLHWQPGWIAVPRDEFRLAVGAATAGGRWVADGNYSAVRDILWPRATHVVWLNYGRTVVFSRVLWRPLSRIVTRTEVCNGNRESLRMAFFSRDSILLWSLTTFAKNRQRYAALQGDPGFAHLQWLEITRPAEADAAIRALARAGAGG